MLKPYMAVLAAYARPWSLRISGGFVLLFIAAGAVSPRRPDYLGGWPTIPLMVACGIFLLLFSVATKEMFTTPLTRLAPRFNRYHLAIAGGVSLCVWLSTSAILAGTTAATLLGVSSLVLAMIAFIGWGALIHPMVLFAFFMLAFLPSMTQVGQTLLTDAMVGRMPRGSSCLLAAAAVSVILLARKLAGLHEEEPGYQRWFDQARGPFSSRQVMNEQQTAAISRSRFVRRRGERLERLLSEPVVGLWLETRRLRLAAGYPRLWWAMAAAIGLCLFTYLLGSDLSMSSGYALVFPTMIVWRSWRRVIRQESVKPVSRPALVQRIGTAMALDVVEMSVAGIVTAITVWLLVSPATLTDPRALCALLTGLCCTPLLVGVASCLLLINSELGFMVVTGLVSSTIPVATRLLWSEAAFAYWPPETSIAVLGLGVACCYGAYRAWLNADLT